MPQVALQEICLTSAQQPLEKIGDIKVYRLRGNLVPVISLPQLLQLDAEEKPLTSERTLVVAAASHGQFAIEVDSVVAMLDIVIKPMLDQLCCGVYAGATILGNGAVAPILDLGLIGKLTSPISADAALPHENAHKGSGSTTGEEMELAILRGPDDARWAVQLSQVERLIRVDPAEVEMVGGSRMIQLSGEIIPLIDIAEILPERRQVPRHDMSPGISVPVVLYQFGDQMVGLIAEKVLDVMTCQVTNRRPPSRFGVSFVLRLKSVFTNF